MHGQTQISYAQSLQCSGFNHPR